MLAPNAGQKSLATRFRRSIHLGAEAVRRAKKYRFNRDLWKAETKTRPRSRQEAEAGGEVRRLPDRTRRVTTKCGRFGYLRIWSFDVDDDEAFIDAASLLVRDLPDRGLIIDIRNNPGGLIWAAERLLQIFTPNVVQPTKFALRTTSTTAEMARAVFNREELGPWSNSLTSAESTGEPYSATSRSRHRNNATISASVTADRSSLSAMPIPIRRAIFSPPVSSTTASGRWSASVTQREPAAPMSGPPGSGGRLAAGQAHAAAGFPRASISRCRSDGRCAAARPMAPSSRTAVSRVSAMT